MSKKVIVRLDKADRRFIEASIALGFDSFLVPTKDFPEELRKRVKLFGSFDGADVKLGEGGIVEVSVRKREDIEGLSKEGPLGYLIMTEDWRVIPLENLIAMFEGTGIKLYAQAMNLDDAKMLAGVLEKGVDGIIIAPKSVDELFAYAEALLPPPKLELKRGRVTEVKLVGMGERVCIDTSNMLNLGEGMLIGSFSNFLFLVHGETIGSEFTAPRPFRVNAGGVHNYILLPDGKTRYLSEISSGDGVLIISPDGSGRAGVVGRAKVERRPLALVRAKAEDLEGGIILQYAETIRLVSPEGKALSITDIKEGDEVLVYIPSGPRGRHFGMAVNEFVIEK